MLTSREELAQTLLLETVAGSLLFLALPRRIFGGKRLLREAAPDIAQRTALKTHLNRAAEALRELYDSMSRTPPPQEENPAVIFDRAAEKYAGGAPCASCAGKRLHRPPSTPSMTLLPTSSSGARPRPRTSPFTSPTAASICQNCCRPSMGSCRPFCCGSSTAANWKKRAAAQGAIRPDVGPADGGGRRSQRGGPRLWRDPCLRYRRGSAAQGGGNGLRRHHGGLPHGQRSLVPAAGGRYGQRGRRPAGVLPHLPAAAAVFGGGHPAGGCPHYLKFRYGPPGCGDRQLYHGGSVRFERLGGHLL